MNTTSDDLAGMDCDWLGVDSVGHVGYFTTAGAGYVPRGFLADLDLHRRAIELLWDLPPVTRGRCRSVVGVRLNPWRLAMERGLYGYDSHPNGGDYKRCAIPRRPAWIGWFPDVIVAAASTVRIDLQFRRSCRVRDRAEGTEASTP